MSKMTSDSVATPPDPNVTKPELRRAAWSSWLGSSLEYMDFTLYTLASALVFGPLFFPNETPAVALIALASMAPGSSSVRSAATSSDESVTSTDAASSSSSPCP